MDALKLIPQLFFDLIGRVVPGTVAVVLALFFFDSSLDGWRGLIRAVVGSSADATFPAVSVSLGGLFVGYLIGHFISPLTKAIQRFGAAFPSRLAPHDSAQYEWLRLFEPDAGALCAKLRAEFTMYNGLSAVFLIFSILVLAVGRNGWAYTSPALLIASMLMLSRGREGYATFRNSVQHLYKASQDESSRKARRPSS